MSFSFRLWAGSLIVLAAFTVWGFLHDYVVPGLSQNDSHALLIATAWILTLGGVASIQRIHDRAERLAEKAARDATVIQMAGAVAHELNQPLTIVVSTAELLTKRASNGDDIKPYLNQLLQAAGRMADIVQKLERATAYHSKPYVGTVEIVDIDRTSE